MPLPPAVLGACVCAAAAGVVRLFFARRFRRGVAVRVGRLLRTVRAERRSSVAVASGAVTAVSFSDAQEMSPGEYGRLSGTQRRSLMEDALQRAYMEKKEAARKAPFSAGVGNGAPVAKSEVRMAGGAAWSTRGAGGYVWDRRTLFWKMLESANGRAAALGFVLCFMREVLEPTHPSLVDQVHDVVLPIAQSTPPLLIAMVDRITDLLT